MTNTTTRRHRGAEYRARLADRHRNAVAHLIIEQFRRPEWHTDGTLTSLSGTLDQADGLFDQLVDTLNQTKTTISSTQDSLRQVASDVATVRTDIATLDSSAAYQKIRDTLHLDDKGFGDFMGNPVTLTTKVVYATDNYGSAVTPFYTNLALWVGGFVLIAIYKLEVDREGIRRITATQAYLGRWLLLVTIGFLQAVIATIGDLVLGIQCEHPLLFILAGIFCSFRIHQHYLRTGRGVPPYRQSHRRNSGHCADTRASRPVSD